jgi:hypothetical protein
MVMWYVMSFPSMRRGCRPARNVLPHLITCPTSSQLDNPPTNEPKLITNAVPTTPPLHISLPRPAPETEALFPKPLLAAALALALPQLAATLELATDVDVGLALVVVVAAPVVWLTVPATY